MLDVLPRPRITVSHHERISCETLGRGFRTPSISSNRSDQLETTLTIINERQSHNQALQHFHRDKHAFDTSPGNCSSFLDLPGKASNFDLIDGYFIEQTWI
jgi:hypothetical protein